MAKALNILDFTMAANGSFQLPVEGSYFRVLTCTGNVAVIGDTFGKLGPINKGQGLENTPYRRLTIQDVSGSANSGTILVSEENFIDQTLYGSITLGSAVALDAATLLALEVTNQRPEAYSGNYIASSLLAANTAEAVFTAASNVNGAIVHMLQSTNFPANGNSEAFLAKATPPANIVDGVLIAASKPMWINSVNTNYASIIDMQKDVFIPSGLGLYYIANALMVGTIGSTRGSRYRLL